MAGRPVVITETASGEWGAASATFSVDRVFRYTLTRTWDPDGPVVNFLMLNPSTADALVLDPTNRRCVGFAQSWGFGAMVTTNIFAFRSTDPLGLRTASDPIGEHNDRFLVEVAADSDLVIAAWGVHGALVGRGEHVVELMEQRGIPLSLLRRTRDGHPCHPLYLPSGLVPGPM